LVNFIVGSVTTYKGKPPSFNIIYVDPETLLPIDFETHTFDLDYANKFDIPLLAEELIRVGSDFDLSSRHFVDVQNIFHKMEQLA
jgi:hypothetical protein